MEQFVSKPYKLYNKIQNYDWGTKNGDALIPVLLGENPETDKPYAELWIGAHPKAPSEIEYEGKRLTLNELIKRFPLGCLGDYSVKQSSNQFPFLLKVLSADRALSIQTHPNKVQAEKLHKSDPDNYPDDNHKPEIAIAIDSLIAIAGFRPFHEIIENLKSLVELKDFVGNEPINKILNSENEKEAEEYISKLYGNIMQKADDKEDLSICIHKIHERLKNKKTLRTEEEQFLQQYKLFGADIGLLSFFFFNLIDLKPGQAIFTDAGVPHAYIKGNIIECMANSDNVVRAGLTKKFKDVKTLLEIIKYDFDPYEIINAEQKTTEISYKTKAKEFEVSSYLKSAGFNLHIINNRKLFVYLILEGSLEVKWIFQDNRYSEVFTKGESFFIPAGLEEFEISTIKNSKYFVVTIP